MTEGGIPCTFHSHAEKREVEEEGWFSQFCKALATPIAGKRSQKWKWYAPRSNVPDVEEAVEVGAEIALVGTYTHERRAAPPAGAHRFGIAFMHTNRYSYRTPTWHTASP
eukprot:GHVU01011997.1.p3 GENE.GHVU01011997.1~~GHVU01011997.1.p3  ORF type:complete len:110 (+),score=9.87 GHVU01011997.1:624-953(+)